MRKVEGGTRNVGCGTKNEERGMWNEERGRWNEEGGTWNVGCGTWNVGCEMRNVEGERERERTRQVSSLLFYCSTILLKNGIKNACVDSHRAGVLLFYLTIKIFSKMCNL